MQIPLGKMAHWVIINSLVGISFSAGIVKEGPQGGSRGGIAEREKGFQKTTRESKANLNLWFCSGPHRHSTKIALRAAPATGVSFRGWCVSLWAQPGSGGNEEALKGGARERGQGRVVESSWWEQLPLQHGWLLLLLLLLAQETGNRFKEGWDFAFSFFPTCLESGLIKDELGAL